MSAHGAAHAPLATPDEAVHALCARILPLETERVAWRAAAGRVLAEPITLDRDSPACDVSAMDGYAVRLADAAPGALDVRFEVEPGVCADPMPAGSAVRVFTGAMIPDGAEAVVPREQVEETPERIRVPRGLRVERGQHIRRRAENGRAGDAVCEPGAALTPARLAAAASCGAASVLVRARVRVGVLVTGDEALAPEDAPAPWQLRDGNGAALTALLANIAWIDPLPARRVGDDPGAIRDAAAALLDECDALLLTGGVSAGDYDHVPAVLRGLGFETVFHKVAIRPGKPVLGAVDAHGQPALGLPGNPVSVMVTARLFAAAALRARAGLRNSDNRAVLVDVDGDAHAPPSLRWFPPVRLRADARAELVRGKGSGDWVSAAGADGFVEVPPGEDARGLRLFRAWRFDDA